jgi:hypothetical protein
MDDNTKFSIREYREALYNEITKKKRAVTSCSQDEIKRKESIKKEEEIKRQD